MILFKGQLGALIRYSLFITAFAVGLQTSPSVADGALAIGLPADVAHHGFASGYKVNAPDMDTARNAAIKGCRGWLDASDEAKKQCKVIATLHNQCLAIAIDPKSGTPGVGWGIAESRDKADEQALAQCRTTAGTTRQQFCVIFRAVDHACDGNAK
jgi:Domain of unknown function (DUF4189)